MTLQVLICDDSSFARKQMARSLPPEWHIDLHFAGDGIEGLEQIRQGHGEVVFLDLTMPNLDGYGVLEKIRQEDLPAMVIVVSGDIQPDAQDRVKKLGALSFIKKPIDLDKTKALLKEFGLFEEADTPKTTELISPAQRDFYQELFNVALGQSADRLAKLLDGYVNLPVPQIRIKKTDDIKTQVTELNHQAQYSVVSQGFIGSGIAGEALMFFNNMNTEEFSILMNQPLGDHPNASHELMIDLSSILIGACVRGMGEQLGIHFNQDFPSLLSESLAHYTPSAPQNALTIEIHYSMEKLDIECDLMVIFNEQSLHKLNNKIDYLLD